MDKINEIEIIYEFEESKAELRIFGDEFVENNKDKCILLINGKKEKLKAFIKKRRY